RSLLAMASVTSQKFVSQKARTGGPRRARSTGGLGASRRPGGPPSVDAGRRGRRGRSAWRGPPVRANMRTNFSDTALGNLCTTRCVAPPSSAFVAPSRVKRPPPRPPAPRSLVQTFLRVGTGRKSGNGSNSRARPARAADWKDRVDRALTRSSNIPVAMHAEPAYVLVMSPPATVMTAEDLLQTRFPDKRTALVRGVLVVREPAGSRPGLV